jgi:hypothetical protein
VLHDAPDACEFPPPSRIRCCVVVAATPSPWNDVPPPPTAFTTSALSDDASVESMTSSSLLPILKESERWVQKRFSTHTELLSLSLFQRNTQLHVHTQPKIFQECYSSKISKCFITHPSSTICSRIHQHPSTFPSRSIIRFSIQSTLLRTTTFFFSGVCVCVFPFF